MITYFLKKREDDVGTLRDWAFHKQEKGIVHTHLKT